MFTNVFPIHVGTIECWVTDIIDLLVCGINPVIVFDKDQGLKKFVVSFNTN